MAEERSAAAPSESVPARSAILLLAHGTPDSLDEIPEYLGNVTGGRPMPDAVIAEIRHRYSLIGSSPLTVLTLEQGRLLQDAIGVPVYVGMRNWKPYIAAAVEQMRADGIRSAVAICLAPQNSRTSVGLYRRAVSSAAGDSLTIDFVEGWADHPQLADAFAERLRPLYARITAERGKPVPVLFTAHSVPCRTVQTAPAGASSRAERSAGPASPPSSRAERSEVEGPASSTGDMQSPTPVRPAPSRAERSEVEGPASHPSPTPDPYSVEAKRTAALVAERVGLPEGGWYFAFQSQGMSGGPWIGPTVEDTLTTLRQAGHEDLILQPIGFLCDHVEILYDIDIAFRDFAAKLGMRLVRPESLNASPLLTAALVDLARQGLARLAAQTTPTPA